MKKRRMFDLDLPDEAPEAGAPNEIFPAGKIVESEPPQGQRRGPMATAVSENAEALRTRASAEAAIRAENDALAGEMVRLRSLGLIVDLVAIDLIDAEKLVRDRGRASDMDLSELKASIRDVGLSNPIRVEPAEGGRYELIQGLRRLSAYRELLAETGEETYRRIPAGLMADGAGLDALYRRMVDENLVRKDISFAEMAELARAYVADPRTGCDDVDKAVTLLFQSAGYQKRSYIRAFVELLDGLGDLLQHSQEIPRNLGLDLRRRLEAQPELRAAIAADLEALDRAAAPENRSAGDELAVLRRRSGAGEGDFPAGKVRRPGASPAPRKARVTFEITRPLGPAKCTAANGRFEVRLPLDFTTVDRRKLEAAVRQLLDALGGSG